MNNQNDNNVNNNINNNINNNFSGIPPVVNANTAPIQSNGVSGVQPAPILNQNNIPESNTNTQINNQYQGVQNQNTNSNIVAAQQSVGAQQVNNQGLQQNNSNQVVQNQFQSIPTIEQSNQNFVANTQTISSEKNVDNKKKVNYLLIIILLAVVFGVVFFVFPLLKNIF